MQRYLNSANIIINSELTALAVAEDGPADDDHEEGQQGIDILEDVAESAALEVYHAHINGSNMDMTLAHSGILLTGVKIPLMRMNTMMMKNIMNIACCMLLE